LVEIYRGAATSVLINSIAKKMNTKHNKSVFRIGLSLLCCSILPLAYGQNLVRLSMDLKLNSKREIVTATNSKIYLDGEVVSDELNSFIYEVELIDTLYRPTFAFTKRFSDALGAIDLNKANQQGLIELFVKITEERLKSLTYHILFDEKSREAVEIVNDSVYNDNMERLITDTQRQFADFMEDDVEGKAEFTKNLANYLSKSKRSVLDEVLTEFNDLMAPYAYQFPAEGEFKDSVAVNDIPLFSQVPNNEVKAQLTITSALDKNQLIISSSLDYDKKTFIDVAKRANAAFHELEAKDINIIERNNFEADLVSKWLKKYSSERIISIPGIKVIYVNTYTFYE
jgi:hypothetical protein